MWNYCCESPCVCMYFLRNYLFIFCGCVLSTNKGILYLQMRNFLSHRKICAIILVSQSLPSNSNFYFTGQIFRDTFVFYVKKRLIFIYFILLEGSRLTQQKSIEVKFYSNSRMCFYSVLEINSMCDLLQYAEMKWSCMSS